LIKTNTCIKIRNDLVLDVLFAKVVLTVLYQLKVIKI